MCQRIKVAFGIFALVAVSCFSGCKLVRDVDIGKVNIATPTPTKELESPNDSNVTMQPTQNPVTIVVENGPALSEEGLLSYCYGEDRETLLADGYIEEFWYEDHMLQYQCDKNGIVLLYTHAYDLDAGDSKNVFSLKDMNEGAAISYEPVCGIGNINTRAFCEDYPEIDLDSCTREEAIAACAPLAEVCGYGDAQVKAYAITEQFLKEFTAFWDADYKFSAPKPDYEYVSKHDMDEAIKAGDEQLVNQLKHKKTYEQCTSVDWTKEHEAYVLVYNSVLNGRVLLDSSYQMYCVYVPKYDKVVYASGEQPLVAVKGLEETTMLTEEEAIEKSLRLLKIESPEDITITDIRVVYCTEYEKVNKDIEEWTIDPCWKIDYVLSDKLMEQPVYANYKGTILINAMSGKKVG